MSEKSDANLRVDWADAAKGVAIILVVVGHQISGLANAGLIAWSSTWRFFYDWIYSFHVPVFFFIAGMFLSKSLRKPFSTFVLDKIRVLLFPYFVWSSLTLIVKFVFADSLNHPYEIADFFRIFYNPIDQYWFLYVLFFLYLYFALQLKFGLNRWAIVLVAAALDPRLSPAPFPPSPPIIEAGLSGLFMALGVAITGGATFASRGRPGRSTLGLTVVVGYALASLATLTWGPRFEFLSIAFTIGGVVATIALSLLVEGSRLGAAIQYLGRRSLEIYVVHTLAAAGLRVALLKVGHIHAVAPHFILGAIAGVLGPLALVWVLEKAGWDWVFNLPSRFLAAPARVRAAPPSSSASAQPARPFRSDAPLFRRR